MRVLKSAVAVLLLAFSTAALAKVDFLTPRDGDFVDADSYVIVAKCRNVEVLGLYFRVEIEMNDVLKATVDTDGVIFQSKDFKLNGNPEFVLEKVFSGEKTSFNIVGVKSLSAPGTYDITVNLIDGKDNVFDTGSITVYVK